MRAWNLGQIEQAFADAAVDPLRWNAAMDVAAIGTGSVGAVMLPIHGRTPGVPYSSSIAPMIDSYFREGWVHRDARERGVAMMKRRGVFTDLDFTDFDEIKRHPYYQDLLGPHDLRWFGGVRLSFGDDLWCLAIQRSIEQGPYTPKEVQALSGLSQKISGAAALARALGFAGAQAAIEAFELSGTAVILLNRRGEPIRLNRQAETLSGYGIRVSKRKLLCADANTTSALDRALHALIWSNNGSSILPPVPLPRAHRLPLLAYPLKFSSMVANALADCQALLVIVDPEQRKRPPEAALRIGFGLTAAEARLASRLATGETIEIIADQLGVAKGTARNQLKSIFAKVGIKRQVELVTLMASLLGRY